MLRITESKNARGAIKYFDAELSRGDYYADKGNLAGIWGGRFAEALGLTGEVGREAFAALANNLHPETGEQLTANMKENRRSGYDFTVSAPKSVTAFYEYLRATGEHTKADAVLAAMQRANRDMMGAGERDMQARVRDNGQNFDRTTGNIAYGAFTHFQARPVDGYADPHLHIHNFVFNATRDGETTKAGQFGAIKAAGNYYQALFDDRLAASLQAMGYATEREGLSFELQGVERSTVEKYSRRTDQVEKEAAALPGASAKQKARLGARTRAAKDEGLSPEETRDRFFARLNDAERDTLARIASGGAFPPSGGNAKEAL